MRCYICGQDLPEESFYPSELRARSPRCKTCHKARKKELRGKNGTIHQKGIHLFINDGKARRIYWNSNMISDLKKYYPTTKNAELANLFGVSQRTINRKASELGLCKDKAWLIETAYENGIYGKALRNIKLKEIHGNDRI